MKCITGIVLLLLFTAAPLRAQSGIQELTGKTAFEAAIKNNEKAVAIFAAEWCDYCKALLPKVENIRNDYKGIGFFKINYDENKELFVSEGIEMTPTVKLYKNGIKKDEMVIIDIEPLLQKLRDF